MAIDQQNGKELATMHAINDEIVKFALDVGGTCTGEHGVGIGKKRYLHQEHASTLAIMKDIKKLLDPNNLLSPGVLFNVE